VGPTPVPWKSPVNSKAIVPVDTTSFSQASKLSRVIGK